MSYNDRRSLLSSIMEVQPPPTVPASAFELFVEAVEPRLRTALVAAFGPTAGRAATCDALSWAWEHWGRVAELDNPGGYLYRVGRTAARRARGRMRPEPVVDFRRVELPDVHPELIAALADLSARQRSAVLLVHGYGWTFRDAAEITGVSPSTIQRHVERGLAKLRTRLGDTNE